MSSSVLLDSVAKKIEDKNVSMTGQRTTVLKLEYLEMVDILRKFIKGDRRETGVSTFRQRMLCYPTLPAAAAHNLYAKSACLSPTNA